VLLASRRNDVQCVVCSNGGYDLVRHKTPEDKLFSRLRNYKIDLDDEEAFIARSPIYHISTISAPLFLLHRLSNPIVNHQEAIDFHDAMLRAGKVCHLCIKESTPEADPQILTYEEVLAETEVWIDQLMSRVF